MQKEKDNAFFDEKSSAPALKKQQNIPFKLGI